MQQPDDVVATSALSQAIAGATLAYLSTVPFPATSTQTQTLPPRNLPSLLQYVDGILMKGKNRHDHPPYAAQSCASCSVQWDNVNIPSTFLPLSPCNHWIHYRCLIWLATRDSPHNDKCPVCRRQLFEWDGINALTLATRTSVPMGNGPFITSIPGTHPQPSTDRTEYEAECQLIEDLIDQRFSAEIAKPSVYPDGSPDLVQCFNDVLSDLETMGRPHAKWLRWSTTTGSLLFGILVAIKLRRCVFESHEWIVQMEGWVALESGCWSLQRQLLEEVHKR